MSIRTQFLLIAGLTLSAIVAAILVVVIPGWQDELEHGARQRGRAVVGMLANTAAEAAMVDNYSELQRIVNDLAGDPRVVYAAIIDRQGRTVVSSPGKDGKPFFLLEAAPPDPATILDPGLDIVLDGKTSIRGQEVLDFAAPLKVYKRSWGIARLGLSLAPIREATRGVAWRMLALGLVGLVLAVTLVILLVTGIIRPLAGLVDAASRISDRHLETRVVTGGARELRRLGSAFNQMAESVQEHVREVEEKSSELEAGYRVLARLGTTIDRETLMEGVLEVISDVLHAKYCELMALDPRRGLVDRYVYGPEGYRSESLTAEDLGVERLEQIKSMSDRAREFLKPAGDDLFIPLSSDNLSMGGMIARPQWGTTLSERERKLAEGISNHLLVALENARLYELAIRDGLTGLTIRRYFKMRLQEELDRAKRYLQPFSLLMIDIDHFKKVNDSRGHPAGDQVLRAMAARLKGALRSTDLISRYGGEELVAMLPGQGTEQGRMVAEKLRKAVEEEPFEAGPGDPLKITVSIGVATFPDDAKEADNLVHRADKALYAAKQGGRNQVVSAFERARAGG